MKKFSSEGKFLPSSSSHDSTIFYTCSVHTYKQKFFNSLEVESSKKVRYKAEQANSFQLFIKTLNFFTLWKSSIKTAIFSHDSSFFQSIIQIPEPSFTRQLAFDEFENRARNTYSFYNDYRSNLLAKLATVTILFVTALLFIIFAIKNRQIDRLAQEIFDRMDAEIRNRAAALMNISQNNSSAAN